MSGDGKLPTVVTALSAVMEDVQAVRKGDRNQQQGFNFRGIDAVVNAVGPAFRKHGVVAVPVDVQPTFESYQSRQGAQMRNCVLRITWRFYGPMGDHVEAVTLGEASDAGDKSVPKAHSVAYRILLLQALCIPTDEPDPDTFAHERAAQQRREASGRDWPGEIDAETNADSLRALWQECAAWGELTDDLRAHFTARASKLATDQAAEQETPAVEVGADQAALPIEDPWQGTQP